MTNERVDELIQNASVDEIKKVIKDENLNMNISQILVLIEATGDIDFIRECMKNEELGVNNLYSQFRLIASAKNIDFTRECINDESLNLSTMTKITLIALNKDVEFARQCINDKELKLTTTEKFELIKSLNHVDFTRECINNKKLKLSVEEKIQLIKSTRELNFIKECVENSIDLGFEVEDTVELIIEFGDKNYIKECIEDNKLDSFSKVKLINALDVEDFSKFISDNNIKLDSETNWYLNLLSFDEKTIKEEVDFSKMRNFNLPQTMTIGMEIECEGLLADEILKCFNFKDWKAVEDGSLDNGVEIVSPILHSTIEEAKQIYSVNHTLQKLGQEVSYNCGAHVHIGSDYLTSIQAWMNFTEIYCNTEKLLYLVSNKEETLPRLHVAEYAKTMSPKVAQALEKGSINLTDEASLDNFILELQSVQADRNLAEIKNPQELEKVLHDGRYSGINLLNINNGKNTIEFRHANGTLDPDLWIDNINLFGGIVAISEELANIQEKENINDEDKSKLSLFEKLKDDIEDEKKLEVLLELLDLEPKEYLERFRSNVNLLKQDKWMDKEFFEQKWDAKENSKKMKELMKKSKDKCSALAQFNAIEKISREMEAEKNKTTLEH